MRFISKITKQFKQFCTLAEFRVNISFWKITRAKFLSLPTFVKQKTLLPEKFLLSAFSGVEKELAIIK